MKWKWAATGLLALLLCFSFALSAGCGDDDDDDDNDDEPADDDDDAGGDDDDDDADDDDADDDITPEQFCEKVAGCEEIDAYVIEGACEASAAAMTQKALNCAQKESCDDFIKCVEGTKNGWAFDTINILSTTLFISAPDFVDYYPNEKSSRPKVSPNELGRFYYQYDDREDCDLGNGAVWVSLDGGDYEKIRDISPSAQCRVASDSYYQGFDLADDFMEEGDHEIYTVFTDKNGRQSEPKKKSYSVEDYAYAIGSTMADFTLWGINGPAKALEEISLSQFAGQVVLINSMAMW